MEFSFRSIEKKDYLEICKLPQTEQELYFMFPAADFPLTEMQFAKNLEKRFAPTVFLDADVIIGFANFYDVEVNNQCSLGNVIVDIRYREKGVGKFIIQTMERQALQLYNISEINIACFNDNTTALKLYHKLGYIPFEIEERYDKHEKCHMLIKMKKIINDICKK